MDVGSRRTDKRADIGWRCQGGWRILTSIAHRREPLFSPSRDLYSARTDEPAHHPPLSVTSRLANVLTASLVLNIKELKVMLRHGGLVGQK